MNWKSKRVDKSAGRRHQNQHSKKGTTTAKPLGFIGAAVTAGALIAPTACLAADWPSAGADLTNSRYQDTENKIKASSVGSLQKKWELTTSGDVQAHPAVEGRYLYFPDSAGFLYKVNKRTGELIWKIKICHYTGTTSQSSNVPADQCAAGDPFASDSARGTPAVAGDLLILGNLIGRNFPLFGQPQPPLQPARVFAVNKNTGNLVWSTKVDSTDLAFVTSSPIVYNGKAYVGVASNEEVISAFVPKSQWVFKFRGSAVALDVQTGAIKWQKFMIPPRPAGWVGTWYAGASIWGSTGAIDKATNQIFMATGNNVSAPEGVEQCLKDGNHPPASCGIDPHDHFDSVVALDLDTGKINWAARGLPNDVYNVSCGINVPGAFTIPSPLFPTPGAYDNCPYSPPGPPTHTDPDWDFAQGPMLLDYGLVGAGQKSGVFWAFKRHTGELVWRTQVVPGGITGGMQWGSATDGKSIFVASANSGTALAGAGSGAVDWTLKDGTKTKAGGWAALDSLTGAVIWTTADPTFPTTPNGSRAEGAVSGTNDVVFGCDLAPNTGLMVAMNAKTGAILWSYASGGPCNAGASIANGKVFWGSGTFSGFGPRKVFAFGLPSKPGDDDDDDN
jgi:polyvinyl alcohol dehydrogenase (cytochrome)